MASYPRFCWSFVAYSSCSRFSCGLVLSMARAAAARASWLAAAVSWVCWTLLISSSSSPRYALAASLVAGGHASARPLRYCWSLRR
ncbi:MULTISPECIES: hypothetical protein [unclassified Micromonospora]|uniref:hypothetical protein n=1 Tax=unclassified Micromonospora TaxID=2617518 RepID=UPI001C5E3CC5|nr:hypothetical protein [Micromonospora sp. RL09-050-HVF-A]MBW4704839.1 hypothetical protein [Micromonospora sp. RL09-050-HVF-A]